MHSQPAPWARFGWQRDRVTDAEPKSDDDFELNDTEQALVDVHAHTLAVIARHGDDFASWHELESVLREECAEFTAEVREQMRNRPRMWHELRDVAAVCVRGMAQLKRDMKGEK